VAFLSLAVLFLFNLWGRPSSVTAVPAVDPDFLKTATVRESAADLVRTGGDASGLDCYACHEKGKPVPIHLDEKKNVILADEHKDLVMNHGRDSRNNQCFNCHDSENLVLLRLVDGSKVKLTEDNQLCRNCHGTTYRDWLKGAHGRMNGYWDRKLGKFERHDCTSCHDPHNPAFPSLTPAPGPHLLHPQVTPSSDSEANN
jgi:predicted CXXCH cytochrome family protein